ncbi:MraY family glycosyltransferase [Phormidesmis sp. 146-12]
MTHTFPSFLIASGLLSFLLVALIRNYLSSYLLDVPNDRSSHTKPTPRGGGLGFVIAFALTSAALPFLTNSEHSILKPTDALHIWSVLLPLAIVGIVDDRYSVPSAIRYLVQLMSASIAVFWFGAFPQPWLTPLGLAGTIVAVVLTIIGMTALINFYNFMDGLDGLVAGVTVVQLGFLAIELNQPILLLLLVALLGFLWWNWSPAKIFMGDVGSTVLGATVAIGLLDQSHNAVQSWSALAITLPLVADAIYTLVRRLQRRENIFKPHRTHIYQRLQQAGWSHASVASSYILMTMIIAANLHFFHEVGALMSLMSGVSAIGLAEVYLTMQKREREAIVTQ